MALLITETHFHDIEVLTESNESGKKNYFIEGIFMQGNLKNRNGRVYPSDILEKEMDRYSKAYVSQKRALGELGHPDGPQINADRVCHLITEMRRDGDNFIGKAKILDTPMGKILKNFIDEDVKTGVSTRGLGSVKQKKDGIMEVQSDFHLAAVDSVTDPSGPNCFVNGIMENTQFFFDIASSSWRPGTVAESATPEIVREIAATPQNVDYEAAMTRLQQLEDMVKSMKKTNTKKLDESGALKMFEKFMSTLK